MAAFNQGRLIKALDTLVAEKDEGKFFFGLLKAYGLPKATIQKLEKNDRSRNIALTEGDFGLARQIYFHPVHNGDVTTALHELVQNQKLRDKKVRFFLVTNFAKVAVYDARVDDFRTFDFADWRSNYDFLLPLTGSYEKPLAYTEHPADVKACEKMGRLYDVIKALNPESEGNTHDLNVFLTRLLFCFFAEDTGIFPQPGQMTQALESLTQENGTDLSAFFSKFFAILDLPPDAPQRKQYPAVLQAFPYVNGGLFREHCAIPKMNAKARNILLECGRLTWNQTSPVIFGSMFQAVMNPQDRHDLGAHYTSEKNILKLIGPLFLDDLKEELQHILKDRSTRRKQRLKDFQNKLASLTFLDPACGCGNFLIVSYREIKRLELQAVKAMHDKEVIDRFVTDDWKADVSKVSINQFYGIELEEFPADIARVSMWLMEHVLNLEFGAFFGASFASIPLKDSANIHCANALTTDWGQIVPLLTLSYIFGNPPFGGALTISKAQKAEILAVFRGVKNAGILDYVTGWYGKAADAIAVNPQIQCAFVSTNSICQGEQVAPLWGFLFQHDIRISFAHQTFKWHNGARDNAGVFCVIIGFCKQPPERKKLFTYDTVTSDPSIHLVEEINGYLLPLPLSIRVESVSRALSGQPSMVFGNMPVDDQNLILEKEDYPVFSAIPVLQPYIKRFMGSRELLHNVPRYCFWLEKAPKQILSLPILQDRFEACRQFRLNSPRQGTKKNAGTPYLFQERRFVTPPATAIVVPCHSSENRDYIAMAFVGQDTIISNANLMIPNGTLYDFGILESRMHMTWMRTVCGRLKSDYRYSRDLCYNTFPWPEAKESQQKKIEVLAQNILDIREFYPDMTLADLYDPDKMPLDLKEAHAELDSAVEKLYRKRPFENDSERLEHLFRRYEKLIKGEDQSSLFEE